MGSSAPSPPTPPDPVTTASAQGASNVATANAQTYLNNPNVVTPYGSNTFYTTGQYSQTLPDGSTATSPMLTEVQSLSPQQQQLYNEQVWEGSQANNAASQGLKSINTAFSNPVTADNLPDLTTSIGTPSLATGYDQGGAVQNGYGQGGALQGGYASGGAIQNSYDAGGAIQSSVPYNLASTNANQNANAPTSFGQTQSAIQSDVPVSQAATTFGRTAGQVQYGLGNTDFSAERDAATNAALQRLAPTMAAQQEALSSNLANQGVTQGSSAWNAAQLSNAQANNDLRLGAVATGDQEQQALFGESATANQLYNAAQQQDYSQQQGRGLFALNATTANNAANLAAGQFHNAAQQQDYGQLLGRGQFEQAGIAENNAANLNQAQFGLAATLGNNASALNAGNFANAAQLQRNGENANAAAFGNAAQLQAEQENAARAAFSNATQGQQNSENAAAAAFSNQAQAQQNSQNQQAATFGNSALTGLFGMNQQAATFGNQAREQSLTDQETINNNGINQISALMHGGQATSGQYQGYNPGSIGQTPISQDTYASAQLAEQNYQTQAQQAAANNSAMFSALGGLFGLGGKMIGGGMFSDRRLKRDVTAFGSIVNGLPVYGFRYLWDAADAPLTLGHMADEVAAVAPHAVYRHPSGFDMVDYGALEN